MVTQSFIGRSAQRKADIAVSLSVALMRAGLYVAAWSVFKTSKDLRAIGHNLAGAPHLDSARASTLKSMTVTLRTRCTRFRPYVMKHNATAASAEAAAALTVVEQKLIAMVLGCELLEFFIEQMFADSCRADWTTGAALGHSPLAPAVAPFVVVLLEPDTTGKAINRPAGEVRLFTELTSRQ